MKSENLLLKKLQYEDIKNISNEVYRHIKNKNASDVQDFMNKQVMLCYRMLYELKSGTYDLPEWRTWQHRGVSGKIRDITTCDFYHRVMMNVLAQLIKPRYYKYIDKFIFNCIYNRGINCKNRQGNPNYWIRREMSNSKGNKKAERYLIWDIRKCYESIKKEVVERELRKIVRDERFIKIWLDLSFCDKGIPIGSALSSINQHLVLMPLIRRLREECKLSRLICFADDAIIFGRKEEITKAQLIIRDTVENYSQLELKNKLYSRGKNETLTLLGYTYTTKKSRLKKATTYRLLRNWKHKEKRSSYIGLIKGATDNRFIVNRIQQQYNMDISQLINKVKIDTPIGYQSIKIEELINRDLKIKYWDARVPCLEHYTQEEINNMSEKQVRTKDSYWCVFSGIIAQTGYKFQCKTSSMGITETLHEIDNVMLAKGYEKDRFKRLILKNDDKIVDIASLDNVMILNQNKQYYFKLN